MATLFTTVGGAESNSYVTVNEADEIASQYPWFDEWNSCGNKEESLIAAAKAMNGLPWIGEKCYPASDAGRQAIEWGQYPDPAETVFDPQRPFLRVNPGSNTSSGEFITWGKKDGTAIVDVVAEFFIDCPNERTVEFFAPDDLTTPFSTLSNGLADNITLTYSGPLAYFRMQRDQTINPGPARFNAIKVDNDRLINVNSLSNDAPQALAWPRSGAECEGEVATCDFIPYTIKEIQVIIAANFCSNPNLIPGNPGAGGGNDAPDGTYIKRQKIDVLEIEYDQYTSNQFNYNSTGDCTDCNDPYLYTVFPWLKDMLGCWVEKSSSTGNRLIRLFRN